MNNTHRFDEKVGESSPFGTRNPARLTDRSVLFPHNKKVTQTLSEESVNINARVWISSTAIIIVYKHIVDRVRERPFKRRRGIVSGKRDLIDTAKLHSVGAKGQGLFIVLRTRDECRRMRYRPHDIERSFKPSWR